MYSPISDYGLNSLLYQTSIYLAEPFTQAQMYGLIQHPLKVPMKAQGFTK